MILGASVLHRFVPYMSMFSLKVSDSPQHKFANPMIHSCLTDSVTKHQRSACDVSLL